MLTLAGHLDRLHPSGFDASVLILHATHTHSGPVIQDDDPAGRPAWETAALEKIAQAVAGARKNLTEGSCSCCTIQMLVG